MGTEVIHERRVIKADQHGRRAVSYLGDGEQIQRRSRGYAADMESPHKVALIGATGFEQRSADIRVECYGWDRLGSIANLRDYHSVVLNLLSIDIASVDRRMFERVLNPQVGAEILKPGGQIIVVGDPRFEIPSDGPNGAQSKQIGAGSEPRTFLDWTCMRFEWDDRPGDTVNFNDVWSNRMYKEYIQHLKRWRYSMMRATLDTDAIAEMFDLDRLKKAGFGFGVTTDLFCTNRYGDRSSFCRRSNLPRTKR